MRASCSSFGVTGAALGDAGAILQLRLIALKLLLREIALEVGYLLLCFQFVEAVAQGKYLFAGLVFAWSASAPARLRLPPIRGLWPGGWRRRAGM